MVLADRLRPAHLAGFAEHLAKKYGLQYVTDGGSDTGSLVHAGAALIAPHISPRAFLRENSLTVGNVLCFPFSVTDPTPVGVWSLPWQFMQLAHATTHALQSANHWIAPLGWDYFTDERARADYEAQALRVFWELHPLLFAGLRPDPYALAERARAYGCGDATLAQVRASLLEYIDRSERQGRITRAGHDAIVWLADRVY